jgi:hypothetical protein
LGQREILDSLSSGVVIKDGGLLPSASVVLSNAIKAVPSVKWALGVAGIVAVLSIVAGFKIDWRIAVFGTVLMFIFMAVLVIFAAASSLAATIIALPATILVWFCLVFFVATASCLFTWMVADWPGGVASILDPVLRPHAQPGTGLLTPDNKTPYVRELTTGAVPSGNGAGWSGSYDLKSESPLAGYVIDLDPKATYFAVSGDRQCESGPPINLHGWLHCAWTTHDSQNVSFHFELQGHSELELIGRGQAFSTGTLHVTYVPAVQP